MEAPNITNSQTILGGEAVLEVLQYLIQTTIKSQYQNPYEWYKNRHSEQQNRTEDLEINPHIQRYAILAMSRTFIRKKSDSANNFEETGDAYLEESKYPYLEELTILL